MKKLIIYEDEEHTLTETTGEVFRLLSEGFTSGIDPSWEIEEKIDKEKITITMYGVDLMEELGGSFVKSIAEAWRHADADNKKKLEENFKYFEEYELQAERRKK